MRVSRPDTIGADEKPLGDAQVPKIRGAAIRGFPYLPVGCTVVVLPDKRATKTSKGGVVQVLNDSEKRSLGIIVAMGPGEFMAYMGFVSPAVHYGLELRDLVMTRMDCGEKIRVDDIDYVLYRPEDIVLRANKMVAIQTRLDLIEGLKTGVAHHTSLGEAAGEAISTSGAPKLPDTVRAVDSVKEYGEMQREIAGKATKAQIVVPGNSDG